MTEAQKWLENQASKYADLEMIKIMPIIRSSLIQSYIKGFSTASVIAANSKKEENKKEAE